MDNVCWMYMFKRHVYTVDEPSYRKWRSTEPHSEEIRIPSESFKKNIIYWRMKDKRGESPLLLIIKNALENTMYGNG